ncbi:DUF2314 domain-containing protein [Simiduia curdlanivorans]|uniref:YegJ family protein n=1 Tax=Simiduia curdlanivorans TaxID=1492769 RepID=A0ABV8V9K3_9GAMM|nr:DUF2314 domain-containing protein [Simiduia curdlanivorans]MDN3639080.1 DUF2314 domain-containing protein [Simiduia curdlanivorans]
MKKILFTILCLFSISVFSEEKIGDQIRYADESDREMNEAISRARSELSEFFKVAESPPNDADEFKLKVMVSDESGVEHLWFSPFKKIEGGYAGVLVNQPGVVQSMAYGEVYAFKKDQITDWGYVFNGKQVGSYTICVLFKTMPVNVVEQYKNDHGFDCKS